eukprot:scaffold14313_cov42-Isochrysis_galbana.AAC.1
MGVPTLGWAFPLWDGRSHFGMGVSTPRGWGTSERRRKPPPPNTQPSLAAQWCGLTTHLTTSLAVPPLPHTHPSAPLPHTHPSAPLPHTHPSAPLPYGVPQAR